ncbi:hypothetical protein RHS01_03124 [Rhizoctonia solani]|uniref:DUF6699 domain-containing protein n=1 Tax=Rhizoctonia solani TaxID=456999 RepID=A0A8H7M7R4_9AGAM|nr:hypothetical protein RHS01_03124 [Rhizoctonia solani]
MTSHHHCYTPIIYGDPNSPYPRVQDHYPTPHPNTQRHTPLPSNSTSRFSRQPSQRSERTVYANTHVPPDPAFTQWNAAVPVPRGRHAFYSPGQSISSLSSRSRDLPPTHAQTLAARRPHDHQEGSQQMGFGKSRKLRGISAVRSQPRARGLYNNPLDAPRPVELYTHPLGQVPDNLFTRVSTFPQTYQLRPYEDSPPFVPPNAGRAALLQHRHTYLPSIKPHAPYSTIVTPAYSYKMAFYPRSMFLDDAEINTHSARTMHRSLDRFSRRKSRSDISSDYDNDLRSTSDFDPYDRLGHPNVEADDDYHSKDSDRDPRKYRVEYVDDFHNPKLRRRKSFKRMFEVPTGITNFFDGSRERERRYFNCGGRFALHTLLDAHADIRVVGDGYTYDPRVLDEPATCPAISKLRILVADLPWIIRVQNPNGVTLRDIADAHANPRGVEGGLRRYECLVDTTMFMGLVKKDALVKHVAGEDAVEWTWVMLGPR